MAPYLSAPYITVVTTTPSYSSLWKTKKKRTLQTLNIVNYALNLFSPSLTHMVTFSCGPPCPLKELPKCLKDQKTSKVTPFISTFSQRLGAMASFPTTKIFYFTFTFTTLPKSVTNYWISLVDSASKAVTSVNSSGLNQYSL